MQAGRSLNYQLHEDEIPVPVRVPGAGNTCSRKLKYSRHVH